MADAAPPPLRPARKGPPWVPYIIDGAPAVAFLAVLLITRDFRLATWFVVGGAILSLGVSLIADAITQSSGRTRRDNVL